MFHMDGSIYSKFDTFAKNYSSINVTAELMEAIGYTIMVKAWCEYTQSTEIWKNYCKYGNGDGGPYHLIQVVEYRVISFIEGVNAVPFAATTLGAAMNSVVKDNGNSHGWDSIYKYIDRSIVENIRDNQYLKGLKMRERWSRAFANKSITGKSNTWVAGYSLGASIIAGYDGIPIIGSNIIWGDGEYKPYGVVSSYYTNDGTKAPGAVRGFGVYAIRWKKEGSGLKIENGVSLDVTGELIAKHTQVASMLQYAEEGATPEDTTNIEVLIEVKPCPGETKNLSDTSKPVELSIEGTSLSGASPLKLTLTRSQALDIASGSKKIKIKTSVVSNGKPAPKIYYQGNVTYTVGNKEVKCMSDTETHDSKEIVHDYASWLCVEGGGGSDHPVGSGGCTQCDESPKKVWFEYHSEEDPKAWAQIKANECKNEDWEVLQGIPSTENLFVAVGGETFVVDFGGTFETQKDIKRYTKFVVDVINCWETITPCELKCQGHPVEHQSKTITSDAADGTSGTYDSAGEKGEDGEKVKCSCCGTEIQAKGGAGGKQGSKDSEDKVISEPGAGGAGQHLSHSCSYSGVYYCSDGSGSGNFTSSNVVTIGSNIDNRYMDGYITCVCKCGDTKVSDPNSGALLDEGYTTAMGCECDNTHNFEHPQKHTWTWTIEENIPIIFYLNITNYAIHGLYRAEVTSINDSLLEGSADGQSVLQSIAMTAYDIPNGTSDTSKPWGKYSSGNGRLYFTQYKDADYMNNENGGWESTKPSSYYWLGDSTIHITVYADDPSTPYSPNGTSTHGPRKDGGKSDGQQEKPDPSENKWTNGLYSLGDLVGTKADGKSKNQAACMVTQWMKEQDRSADGGHCIVVSDQLAISVLEVDKWKSQDLVNTMYEIEDGWAIFAKDATAANEGENNRIDKHTYVCPSQTVNSLFNDKSDYNFRAIYNNSDMMKYGFTGSPSTAVEGTGSYTDTVTGNKVKNAGSLNGDDKGDGGDGPTSLSGAESLRVQRGVGWLEANDLYQSGCDAVINTKEVDYPYMSTTYRTKVSLDITSQTGSSKFKGFYEDYTYEGYAGGGGKVNKNNTTTNSKFEKGVTAASNNAVSNMGAYGIPMVMSSTFNIKDWIPNGEYSEPVTVYAYWGTLAKKEEGQSEPPNWTKASDRLNKKYLTDEGVKIGYNGINTPINSVVIHDPVSVEGCYIVSNDITDPGHDHRVDAESDGDASKRDYAVAGNDIFIWYSDIANLHDSGGHYGATSPSKNLGTGTGGPLFSNQDYTEFNTLKSALDFNGGDTGNGYMDRMYTTNWVYDRYVKFPFAVTYVSNGRVRKTAAAGQWISLSQVATCDKDKNYNTNTLLKINNTSGSSSGPPATLYPFNDGNDVNMGWLFCFMVDTSMEEANATGIEFGVIANNQQTKGNVLSDISTYATGLKYFTNTRSNNEDRSGTIASSNAKVRRTIDLVGRIGNLTIHDTGDFRYSNLFKVTSNEYLQNGVVMGTYEERPYHVVSDELDIMQNTANASTNGHATTSIMYKQDYNKMGNTVKTGKADADFVPLPLTPAKNNLKEFKSESIRLGYPIYLDIETWGNYYGVNKRSGKLSFDDEGNTINHGLDIDSYDDINERQGLVKNDEGYYNRDYVTEVNIRYFLLDLETSEYVPIDVYYGEQGNREVCFQFDKLINSDYNLYVEMNSEFDRRNGTDAELLSTMAAMRMLNYKKYRNSEHESSKASNPFDYSRDFIGYADQLRLDQKDRTFIGSSVLHADMIDKDGSSIMYVNANPTDTYTWDNSLKGQNTKMLGQQMQTFANLDSFDLDHIYYSEAAYGSNADHYNSANGISEQEYAAQAQRWYMTIGLPSTSYIVPAQCGPNLDGTDRKTNYLSKYVPGKDDYKSQLVIEEAHDNLLREHPVSTIVCAIEVLAKGEVWELRYQNKSTTKEFKVYDSDAEEQPEPIRDKTYEYPKGYEDWMIIATFEPSDTSFGDLSTYGTH